MYDHLLVPTDGSAPATAAVDHAADLAAVHGASIHLLYVIETATLAPTLTGGDAVAELERRAETVVDEAAERLPADRPTHTAVARGPPHRAILDYAATSEVDLLVMGTHGRTGLAHALLGSVAERMVRFSEVPVLTVRPGAAADEGDDTPGDPN